MVSELTPKPCPSHYCDILLSSTLGFIDIIVTLTPMMSTAVVSTLAAPNSIMSSKSCVFINPDFSRSYEEGKYEPSCKCQLEDCSWSVLSGSGHSSNQDSFVVTLADLSELLPRTLTAL